MAQYDKMVIHKLLDTYESSLLSIGENTRTVHIEFRFTKKNFPQYFVTDCLRNHNFRIYTFSYSHFPQVFQQLYFQKDLQII